MTGEVSKEYDSTISAGHVISQGVEAGTQVAPGDTVDYTLSLGPEAPKKQFIASLDASYPLQVSYGPGAASSEIQILIRLKQTVNGKVNLYEACGAKVLQRGYNPEYQVRQDPRRGRRTDR